MEDSKNSIEKAAVSARKNILANKKMAILKFLVGIYSRNMVMMSEAGHDVGDASVHKDHEKELYSSTPEEARAFAVRGAKKLGFFSLLGAGVEIVIENMLTHSPNHYAGLAVSAYSLAYNVHLYRDAKQHDHERAHSLRSHTYWDQYVSGVTFADAVTRVTEHSVNPMIHVGLHVAISFAPVVSIYLHKSDEIASTSPPDGDTNCDKAD